MCPVGGATFVGNGYPTNKSQVYVSNWFTVAFPNITDSSVLDLALSVLTPKNDPITLLHSFAIKSSMFKGDCLSLNTDNGHASLSRYVMLCHASDTNIVMGCDDFIVFSRRKDKLGFYKDRLKQLHG